MNQSVEMSLNRKTPKKSQYKGEKEWKNYWKHRRLMILFLPGLAYFLIFHYFPIYGVTIAFKDFQVLKGINGSPWIGFQHFEDLFALNGFWQVFRNTLIISFYKLVFGFPAPIIFALLLNELRSMFFKRFIQTVSYLPHFVSWVILSGIFIQFLSPSMGPINIALKAIGLEPIYFLADSSWFRSVLVSTDVWKDLGWGAIIYLAALSGINPDLYEASTVDGANRWDQMWHITLPGIVPVVVIMFIFAVGKLLSDDFDQVFNLYNPAVYDVGDVLSTYTYRSGLESMQFSFATAIGLFKNVISFALIIIVNQISKKFSEYSLW